MVQQDEEEETPEKDADSGQILLLNTGDLKRRYDENKKRSSRSKATGPLSSVPDHLAADSDSSYLKHKSNSTSTVYSQGSLSLPDQDLILVCMSQALMLHIQQGHRSQHPVYIEIFDEQRHPIQQEDLDFVHVPRQRTVYRFLHMVFRAENLPSEVAILCLSYVERVISEAQLTMMARTWRRITLAALILASKVWEDQAVWNVDFVSVFPSVDVQDLNELEKVFLKLIQYNVSLPASMYAKYYFELRALAEADEKIFPLEPLGKDKLAELERRSISAETDACKLHRTTSAEKLLSKRTASTTDTIAAAASTPSAASASAIS